MAAIALIPSIPAAADGWTPGDDSGLGSRVVVIRPSDDPWSGGDEAVPAGRLHWGNPVPDARSRRWRRVEALRPEAEAAPEVHGALVDLGTGGAAAPLIGFVQADSADHRDWVASLGLETPSSRAVTIRSELAMHRRMAPEATTGTTTAFGTMVEVRRQGDDAADWGLHLDYYGKEFAPPGAAVQSDRLAMRAEGGLSLAQGSRLSAEIGHATEAVEGPEQLVRRRADFAFGQDIPLGAAALHLTLGSAVEESRWTHAEEGTVERSLRAELEAPLPLDWRARLRIKSRDYRAPGAAEPVRGLTRGVGLERSFPLLGLTTTLSLGGDLSETDDGFAVERTMTRRVGLSLSGPLQLDLTGEQQRWRRSDRAEPWTATGATARLSHEVEDQLLLGFEAGYRRVSDQELAETSARLVVELRF